MKINGIIWLRNVVDKLAVKHHVEPYEVEQALSNQPKIRWWPVVIEDENDVCHN